MALALNSNILSLGEAFVTTPVPWGDQLVIAPVVLMLLGACVGMLFQAYPRVQGLNALVFTILLLFSTLLLFARVAEHGPIAMTMGRWLPPFGITFLANPFNTLLTSVTAFLALCLVIYGWADSDFQLRRYGFYPLFMILLAGVNGTFLTDDLFNLYVWFEVLLIASFGLLILGNSKIQLDGAVKYAFLNFLATTLFLISIGYLYGLVGALNFQDIGRALKEVPHSAPIETIFVLFVLAFAIKAAAFPVNFWLPASYHTPRIVVTALFAALVTKVGIYALLRISVLFMGQIDFSPTGFSLDSALGVLAIATMFSGVLGALAQSDLRRLFCYLIISGIGFMLAGLAIGNLQALTGVIVYMVTSMGTLPAIYIAGAVAGRCSGGFDLHRLGGMYGRAPFLSGLFFILALTLSGFPPFLGFWSKFLLLKAALEAHFPVLAASLLVSSFLTILAVMRVWSYVFWRAAPTAVEGDGALPFDDSYSCSATPRLSGWEGVCILGPLLALSIFLIAFSFFPNFLLESASKAALELLSPEAVLQMGGISL